MACCSPGGFFGILPVVKPPILLQAVCFGSASHKLPHSSCPCSGQRQWMEARLGLRQINQILRNSFIAQRLLNHRAITATARQRGLKRPTTPRREVIDITRNLIGHHQRQIRVRCLHFGFCLCLDVLIYRESGLVSLVDRCWRRFLLGEPVTLLQRLQLQAIYPIQDLIKFLLQSLVRADVQRAREQQIESAIKTFFGGFQVPGLVVLLTSLIFLLDLCDQFSRWISNCAVGSLWYWYRLRVACLLGRGGGRLRYGRRACLFCWQQGIWFLRRLTGCAAEGGSSHQDKQRMLPNAHVFYSLQIVLGTQKSILMLLSTFGWVNLELGWPPLLWEPFVQVTTRSFSEFPIQPPHPVNHSLRRLNAS